MAPLWFFRFVSGLAVTAVFSPSFADFADSPPQPTTGRFFLDDKLNFTSMNNLKKKHRSHSFIEEVDSVHWK